MTSIFHVFFLPRLYSLQRDVIHAGVEVFEMEKYYKLRNFAARVMMKMTQQSKSLHSRSIVAEFRSSKTSHTRIAVVIIFLFVICVATSQPTSWN